MTKFISRMIVSLIASFSIVFFLISPMLEDLPKTPQTVAVDSNCQQVYKENLINEPSIGIGFFKSFKASPNLEHADVYICAAQDIDNLFTGI